MKNNAILQITLPSSLSLSFSYLTEYDSFSSVMLSYGLFSTGEGDLSKLLVSGKENSSDAFTDSIVCDLSMLCPLLCRGDTTEWESSEIGCRKIILSIASLKAGSDLPCGGKWRNCIKNEATLLGFFAKKLY